MSVVTKLEGLGRGRNLGWLVGLLGVVYGVAAVGGLATSRSVETWFRTVRKPSWNPPDWVFAPVWTVLYTMMAVAAWLVRRRSADDPRARPAGQVALGAWGVQLAFNLLWSLVFFGRRSIAGGLGVIVVLWLAIAGSMVLMGRVSRGGTLLLAPYLAWTTFASLLNYRIWRLNRAAVAGMSVVGSPEESTLERDR
jgi:tryptophan-rich sensory protein